MSALPSKWLRGLVGRLVPDSEQHALGDLDEEFAQRVRPERSRIAAELWYAREALTLLWAVRSPSAHPTPTPSPYSGRASWSGVGRDIVHVLRGLRRSPGTTLTVVLTLTVALGATTALFTVADAAFLRPLPYPDADRLVHVYTGSRDDPEQAFSVSPLDWRDFDGFDAVVAGTAVWTVGESVHLTGVEEPVRLEAPRASTGLFALLGLEPEVGRFFLPEEEESGRDDAVVLSHGLWQRAYGESPDVIGRTMELDGRPYRIVGVAPPGAVLPRRADAWRALALGPEWYEEGRWGWQFLQAIALLEEGVGLEDASAALNQRLALANPDRAERLGQTRLVRSLYDERRGRSGPAILMLLAAVGLLLAMACANVMNVIRARSNARAVEYALRRALGSGAASLARLVALETLVLAMIGGAGGALLAALALRAVEGWQITSLAAFGPLDPNVSVIGFGLLATVATAALFGAAPVRDAVRADPQSVLAEHGARGGGSSRAAGLRDLLVVVQVALALVLLVSVTLSARTFGALVASDPGFDAAGVLSVTVESPRDAEMEAEARWAAQGERYRSLLERVGALPGVLAASAVNFLPLEGVGWSSSFELIDPTDAQRDLEPGANMRAVAPDYFETMGIAVVEGRGLGPGDVMGQTPVAVVDRRVARTFWPGRSPIGTQAVIGGLSREPATIVGVVDDVPDERLDAPGGGHVYFPVLQSPQRRMTLVVRAAGGTDPGGLAPAVRAAVREVEPRMPVTDVATVEARVRDSLSGLRVSVLLLSAFGAAAVLLAALGIYGVLAYSVSTRRAEIGIRVAVGAAPGVVLRSIVTHAMRLWATGAVLGAVGSVGAVSLLRRTVAGVDAGAPLSYLAVFAGLAVVAAVAAVVPAGRATRIDPVEAMRPR